MVNAGTIADHRGTLQWRQQLWFSSDASYQDPIRAKDRLEGPGR
ncbi:hypothetical protein BKP43_00420 [Variovorax boronicumulans]|nr:hypothetical protein BKP43_00420 [Variovorax boronicumulans]